jgi:hypothetical protein
VKNWSLKEVDALAGTTWSLHGVVKHVVKIEGLRYNIGSTENFAGEVYWSKGKDKPAKGRPMRVRDFLVWLENAERVQ